MTPLALFGLSFCVSILCAMCIRAYAARFSIVDKPDGVRKLHGAPTPLLGGIGIFASVFIVSSMYAVLSMRMGWSALVDSHVLPSQLFGIALALLVIACGGFLDDRYTLAPRFQIIAPLLAVCIAIASGITIERITNPFGGVVQLSTPWQEVFTALWLLIIMYTTKFLDGLDGLVSGITAIGATIIGFLSLFFFVNIPTAFLSFIIAGSFAGFLVFNFYPARLFLGEAGSIGGGFLLGTLALLSGAKLATALLVLGIPVLDAAWVIFQRIITRQSPFRGDRRHIHFRLIQRGYSQRQAVMLLYGIAALFGGLALFLQSRQKVLAIGSLGILMILLIVFSAPQREPNH